jgi:hypothetical protein
MEEKYNVRPIRVEDYVDLIEWWKSYDHVEIPSSDLLPNSGLGGLAIEKNGKMIAAAYVYLTNSAMGYIDFLVSDPNYKGKDKFKILLKLMEDCTAVALQQGCRIVWAMTTYQVMADIAEEMGHDVLEDKYSVIYTHHKVHEKMTKK